MSVHRGFLPIGTSSFKLNYFPVSIPRGFLPRGISSFRLANTVDDYERIGAAPCSMAHWCRDECHSIVWCHLVHIFTSSFMGMRLGTSIDSTRASF